jgi:uncharacterized RDD family membrane protein YckC
MPAPDPRELITPERFAVAEHLLGKPLARPWRRALAMGIDLLVIVLLAHAGGLLFAVALAALFFRLSARTGGGLVRRTARRAYRLAGVVVVFVIAVQLWPWGSGGPAPATPVERASVAAAVSADLAAAGVIPDERLVQENRRLRAELAGARSGSTVLRWLRGLANDLGLGFGWAGLYFTAFTVLCKGRTPGKRALRVRVMRLDGEPLGWWAGFGRFGGYAAGFATGLLGFLQVFWDRNRQAIHDKIAETVVVYESRR